MTPYYRDGSVTLYHGDMLDVLPRLDHVDHVITDPPYLLDYAKSLTWSRKDGADCRTRDMQYEAASTELLEEWMGHVARLACRWCLVFSDVESLHLWRGALCPPLRYVRTGFWARSNPTPQFSGDRPAVPGEPCTICHGPNVRLRWNGGGHAALWTARHGTLADDANGHPTPKPLPLITQLVELFTDAGETILDPFAGSGTLGRAAKDTGRRAILVEKDEAYCELIVRRLRQETLLGIDAARTVR